jgi:predicted nucleotidyltransferase
MASLAHHLFGRTRSDVLSALLIQPQRPLHVRELARLTGTSAGSLHRELRSLADMGLLLREEVGRQVYYRANPDHPVHAELAQILRKTAGMADVVREALQPLADKVELAFVYGSMAAGTDRSSSDVDLMILGTASFADLARALATAQNSLRREVNPTVMTRDEFAAKLAAADGFVRSVMQGDKLWVMGEEHDLAELAQDRPVEGAQSQRGRSAKASRRHPAQPGRRRSQKHQR